MTTEEEILLNIRRLHHLEVEDTPAIRALIRYSMHVGFREGCSISNKLKKALQEGDTSKGPCETCHQLVTITFKKAPLKHNEDTIPDVLQGFCDVCGTPVSIPHLSVNQIKRFIDSKKV